MFLHRTCRQPPVDAVGTTPAAAYVAYCARARVIDAIEVGDWLVHERHLTTAEVQMLCLAEPWRDGAPEALWVLEHLDGDARSIRESEMRAVLEFAGLPRPEVNVSVDDGLDPDFQVVCDLVLRRWRVVLECDGRHHQQDRRQYVQDIGRYGWMRTHDLRYVQVTHDFRGPDGCLLTAPAPDARAG